MPRIAAIQMASGPEVRVNLNEAARLIALAVEAGAQLIVLPENFACMGRSERDLVRLREGHGAGPMQDFLAQQAQRHSVWLVGGTVPLAADSPNRVRAACLVFDDKGVCRARYDKQHLFDVTLPEGAESYRESETIEAGDKSVVVDSPFGRLGLAVCYDLRFPEIFRRMLDEGLEVIALPAAFTMVTGRAHWETLLRARAIENLCYVVAAAQGGQHANGRQTYGNSMIVDPWGVTLGQLAQEPDYLCVRLDLEWLNETRRRFPALAHRRLR